MPRKKPPPRPPPPLASDECLHACQARLRAAKAKPAYTAIVAVVLQHPNRYSGADAHCHMTADNSKLWSTTAVVAQAPALLKEDVNAQKANRALQWATDIGVLTRYHLNPGVLYGPNLALEPGAGQAPAPAPVGAASAAADAGAAGAEDASAVLRHAAGAATAPLAPSSTKKRKKAATRAGAAAEVALDARHEAGGAAASRAPAAKKARARSTRAARAPEVPQQPLGGPVALPAASAFASDGFDLAPPLSAAALADADSVEDLYLPEDDAEALEDALGAGGALLRMSQSLGSHWRPASRRRSTAAVTSRDGDMEPLRPPPNHRARAEPGGEALGSSGRGGFAAARQHKPARAPPHAPSAAAQPARARGGARAPAVPEAAAGQRVAPAAPHARALEPAAHPLQPPRELTEEEDKLIAKVLALRDAEGRAQFWVHNEGCLRRDLLRPIQNVCLAARTIDPLDVLLDVCAQLGGVFREAEAAQYLEQVVDVVQEAVTWRKEHAAVLW